MSLRVHVPSVFMSLHVYIPFVCLSLRAYVPLYDCCWNSNSSNNGLVRWLSGVHKVTFVPTSVRSLERVQWGKEAHVCDEFVQALRTVKGRFASHVEVEPSFLTTVFMSPISSQLTLWLLLNNRKTHDRQREWELGREGCYRLELKVLVHPQVLDCIQPADEVLLQ